MQVSFKIFDYYRAEKVSVYISRTISIKSKSIYRNKLNYLFKLSRTKYCNNYSFENSNDSKKYGKELNKLLIF